MRWLIFIFCLLLNMLSIAADINACMGVENGVEVDSEEINIYIKNDTWLTLYALIDKPTLFSNYTEILRIASGQLVKIPLVVQNGEYYYQLNGCRYAEKEVKFFDSGRFGLNFYGVDFDLIDCEKINIDYCFFKFEIGNESNKLLWQRSGNDASKYLPFIYDVENKLTQPMFLHMDGVSYTVGPGQHKRAYIRSKEDLANLAIFYRGYLGVYNYHDPLIAEILLNDVDVNEEHETALAVYPCSVSDRYELTLGKPEFVELGFFASSLHEQVAAYTHETPNQLRARVNQMLPHAEVAKAITNYKQLKDTFSDIDILADFFAHQASIFEEGLYAPEAHQPLRILIMGDQGHLEKASLVGNAMAQACSQDSERCHFGISVGDNVYRSGPSIADQNWKNILSAHFIEPFREFFDVNPMSFFLTIGNHDIGLINKFQSYAINNEETYKNRLAMIQAQVAYSSTDQVMRDDVVLWNMPAPYYSRVIKHGDLSIFMAVIDTNHFPDAVGGSEEMFNENRQFEFLSPRSRRQALWLEEELKSEAAYNADWRIIVGHHAIISSGKHGNNGKSRTGLTNDEVGFMHTLYNNLIALFIIYKVDFYLAGHDHILSLEDINPEGAYAHTVQILSGAASKSEARHFTQAWLKPQTAWLNGVSPKNNGAIQFREDILGFFILNLTKKYFALEAFKVAQEKSQRIMNPVWKKKPSEGL